MNSLNKNGRGFGQMGSFFERSQQRGRYIGNTEISSSGGQKVKSGVAHDFHIRLIFLLTIVPLFYVAANQGYAEAPDPLCPSPLPDPQPPRVSRTVFVFLDLNKANLSEDMISKAQVASNEVVSALAYHFTSRHQPKSQRSESRYYDEGFDFRKFAGTHGKNPSKETVHLAARWLVHKVSMVDAATNALLEDIERNVQTDSIAFLYLTASVHSQAIQVEFDFGARLSQPLKKSHRRTNALDTLVNFSFDRTIKPIDARRIVCMANGIRVSLPLVDVRPAKTHWDGSQHQYVYDIGDSVWVDYSCTDSSYLPEEVSDTSAHDLRVSWFETAESGHDIDGLPYMSRRFNDRHCIKFLHPGVYDIQVLTCHGFKEIRRDVLTFYVPDTPKLSLPTRLISGRLQKTLWDGETQTVPVIESLVITVTNVDSSLGSKRRAISFKSDLFVPPFPSALIGGAMSHPEPVLLIGKAKPGRSRIIVDAEGIIDSTSLGINCTLYSPLSIIAYREMLSYSLDAAAVGFHTIITLENRAEALIVFFDPVWEGKYGFQINLGQRLCSLWQWDLDFVAGWRSGLRIGQNSAGVGVSVHTRIARVNFFFGADCYLDFETNRWQPNARIGISRDIGIWD
jgi:hypothetical protein